MVVILNYREIVDYIEEIPKFTSKNPLDHTKALLKCLGDPQNQMQVIHVAGTNGKGSVCAYLDSMLRAGGYKVGLFTSPHLVKINERFKINGEMISDERFVKAFEEVQKIIKKAQEDGLDHPSYFETLFLMGMVVFKEADVDYVVLETGLGGRLDATNTVDHPLACIITSISLDHVEYLGDTIGKIAGEKAGIIKPQVPVIYDGHQPEASEVIEKRANELGSPAFALTEDMYEMQKNTRVGMCFFFAQHYHAAMKYVGPIRKELGFRTVFNILGPLTNPASPEYMLLGVYSDALVEPLARVLATLGVKRGMVLYGTEGLDELSSVSDTLICEFGDGNYKTYTLTPEEFGFIRGTKADLTGGTPQDNAAITLDILEGHTHGARRDTVVLNAAAAFYIAGRVNTIAEGVALAQELIDSGAALKTLEAYRHLSNQ